MKRALVVMALMALSMTPSLLRAQSGDISPIWVAGQQIDPGHDRDLAQALAEEGFLYPEEPFSRLAVGAGVSTLGFNFEASTGLTPHLNLRGVGNLFTDTLSTRKEGTIPVTPTIHLASLRAGVDYFPWQHHGLRLSAGVNLLNENKVDGAFSIPNGQSFTLNGNDYYASGTVKGSGSAVLHSGMPGVAVTAGWGNPVRHTGRAVKFSVEAGVAVVGSPTVSLAIASGTVCSASSGTQTSIFASANCVNGATDPAIQAALLAQADTYKHHLKRLGFYPVVSFGVSYSFSLRRHKGW